MKRLSVIFVALFVASSLGAATAVPIGAAGGWTTPYLTLRNTAAVAVTQKIGHLTFTHPPFDPRIVEDTVTLGPGETRFIIDANKDFDTGLWTLEIDPRIEASSFLEFNIPGAHSAFEVSSVRGFTRSGDSGLFYRIAVNPASGFGAYPTVMNSGTRAAVVELVLTGPNGERIDDWFVSAPPGISQTAVKSPAPVGATIRACLTACNIGAGGDGPAVYVFVPIGPPSGATQAIRYPQ